MYEEIILLKNLFSAWEEFSRGKRKKRDVIEFSSQLSENIFALHQDLKNGLYVHGGYQRFNISDPKPRKIHKALVRDRLLHHAIYRVLYPYFDRKFIHDSYSCRNFKGTHPAMNRFLKFYRKASLNDSQTCWALKCDIRQFFASIDHSRLLEIIARHSLDLKTLLLIKEVVKSFNSRIKGKGIPLGNLTSQLFANIYMNEFDQFMKYGFKEKYYIRFADDFVILNCDKACLYKTLKNAATFLKENLLLNLHPNKVFIKTFASGIDFLGWIHFSDHRVLRTTTKNRMFRNIKKREGDKKTISSYLGLLKHGNAGKLREQVRKLESANGLI